MSQLGDAIITMESAARVRAAARAFAVAHWHRYGRGSSDIYGCECDKCGAVMAWSDAGEFVRTGNAKHLGSLARRCPGVSPP